MTLPSIPDNIYKLFLLAGVFCLGYAYFEDSRNEDKYFSKVNAFRVSIDSINVELMKINHQGQRLVKAADILSRRHNIKNPITTNDSLVYFRQMLSGDKIEVSVSDSLAKLWDDYKENQFKVELFNKQLDIQNTQLDEARQEYEAYEKTIKYTNWTGGFCLILGFIGMMRIQDIQDELLKRQLLDKPKNYKYCQSCGKKFSPIRQASKNTDGATNPAFCSSCYTNGEFAEPELTKEEFQRRANLEVKKRKTWFGRKLLSHRLKNLERWDVDDYF